jgi:arsenite-transporting ATPase
VNQSLAAAETSDPLLAARAAGERRYLDRIAGQLTERYAVVAMQPTAPVGVEELLALSTARVVAAG